MKKIITLFWIFLFVLALLPAQDAFADWQIHYSGKAAKMFGYGGRGNFATKSQCESYRTSRPGFESTNSYCSGFDPPKPYVAPAPTYRPPSGQSTAGQVQQPDPAVLEAQRLQEEEAAKQRAQIAAMEQAAAVQQQQQFDRGKGSLASDLRNRLNASGAANWQALSDCWAARAGQAAQRGDRASAKSYADYSIAAREGKSVPACHAGESPKVPEPPAPTWVPMPGDDIQARVIEEEKRLTPLIANLQGRTEKAKATAEKKRAEVADPGEEKPERQGPQGEAGDGHLACRGEKGPRRGPGRRPQGLGGAQQGAKRTEGPQRHEGARRTGKSRRIGRREGDSMKIRSIAMGINSKTEKGRWMMGTKILLVMMALLLCAAPAWAQQGIPEAAKKHLLAGIDAIEKAKTPSDFDRAVGEFEAAAKIAPDAPECLLLPRQDPLHDPRQDQAGHRRLQPLPGPCPECARRGEGEGGDRRAGKDARLVAQVGLHRHGGRRASRRFLSPKRSTPPRRPRRRASRQNDKIVSVDGKPTKGLTLLQFSELLDGAPGSTCTMDVVRGAQPVKVSFKRTEPFGNKASVPGDRRGRSRGRGDPVEDPRGGRPLHGLQHGLHDPEPVVHADAGVLPGQSEVRQHQRG